MIKEYLKHYQGFKFIMLFLLALNCFSLVFTVPIPLLYVYLIDQVLPSQNPLQLSLCLATLLTLMLFKSGYQYFLNAQMLKIQKAFMKYLRAYFFESYQAMPYLSFLKHKSSDLTSRLSRDLDTLNILLPKGIASCLKDIVMVLAVLSVMFYLHFKLSLLSLFLLPLFYWVYIILLKPLSVLSEKNLEAKSAFQDALQESFDAYKDIRLSSAFDFQALRVNQKIYAAEKATFMLKFQESKLNVVFSFFPLLTALILWGVGGFWVMTHQLSLGEIIAFSYAFNFLFEPISNLFSVFSNFSMEWAALKRVFEISNLPLESSPMKSDASLKISRGEIQLKNLSFAYPNKSLLLNNLNIRFSPAKITVITGSNGSGKSTLFLLLTGLLQANQGSVYIDAQNLKTYSETELNQKIALLPQQGRIFNATLKENILLGRSVAVQNFQWACEWAGIPKILSHFDQGFETVLADQGKYLSGGEKQKIMIARAMVMNPQILLFDEISNHLDSSRELFLSQLRDLSSLGKSVVLISHDQEFIEAADEVYQLKDQILIRKEQVNA